MKKIGLVAAKGEGERIAYCLRALSRYVDEIVYLDDNSPDNTLDIVYSIRNECRVKRILRNFDGERHEGLDRQRLLEAGRDLKGECFVILDADEAFSANSEPVVLELLNKLNPGEILGVTYYNLWRSAAHYRVDPCVWVNSFRPVAYRENPLKLCNYPAAYLHVRRVPIDGKTIALPPEYKFLHFQFIYWPNVQIKQQWYNILERIYNSGLSINTINGIYCHALNETGLRLAPAEKELFYDFFDESAFRQLYHWRLEDLRRWYKKDPTLFNNSFGCPYMY